ncbi:hypothetical protein GGF37_004925 [Kickxella alabastrina]|nr:hypothetical protein GGF37_004925 [Kickxella alabastrina]
MRRFISYDDPQSLQKKVEYVQQKNLKGMMAWGLHGDYKDELMDTLNRVGPLCRGPNIDTDQPLTMSSLASSSATSMWSPTVPLVFLPKTTAQSSPLSSVLHTLSSTLSSGHNEAAQSSSSAAESSEAKSHSPLASAQNAPAPSGAAAESNATPLSIQDSTSGPEFSSTMGTAKAILFDSIGAPYMMIGGTSTLVPFDLAEKIMKIVEKTLDSADSATATATATATLAAVPSDLMGTVPPTFLPPIADGPLTGVTDDGSLLGPVAIPVVDGVDKKKTQPVPSFNPPQWGMATNIFETHASNVLTKSIDSMSSIPKIAHDLNGPPSVSLETNAGFAATFFLTLDPNTPDSNANMGATTVIPFAQMMASARNEAIHGAPGTMALSVGAFSVSATISGASASAGFGSLGDHFSLDSLVAIPIESSILPVGDSASAAAEPTLI